MQVFSNYCEIPNRYISVISGDRQQINVKSSTPVVVQGQPDGIKVSIFDYIYVPQLSCDISFIWY